MRREEGGVAEEVVEGEGEGKGEVLDFFRPSIAKVDPDHGCKKNISLQRDSDPCKLLQGGQFDVCAFWMRPRTHANDTLFCVEGAPGCLRALPSPIG